MGDHDFYGSERVEKEQNHSHTFWDHKYLEFGLQFDTWAKLDEVLEFDTLGSCLVCYPDPSQDFLIAQSILWLSQVSTYYTHNLMMKICPESPSSQI